MSLNTDFRNDIEAAQKLRLPWWGLLLCGTLFLPVIWLFDHFGRLNLALPTFNCIAVLGFLIAVKWKLRRHVWFWIVMTIVVVLHAVLLWYVPWTTKWVPAVAIAAIDSADLVVLLWVLDAVARLTEGQKTAER